jgi:hypothetical protein
LYEIKNGKIGVASIAFGPKGEGGLDDATGAGGAGGAGYQQVRFANLVSDSIVIVFHVARMITWWLHAATAHSVALSLTLSLTPQTSKTVNLIKNEEEKKKEGIWGIKVRFCQSLPSMSARPAASIALIAIKGFPSLPSRSTLHVRQLEFPWMKKKD